MRGLLKISRMKTKSRFVGDLLRKAEPSSKVRGRGWCIYTPHGKGRSFQVGGWKTGYLLLTCLVWGPEIHETVNECWKID